MTQTKKVFVTIMFFAGFFIAVLLFCWFFIKMQDSSDMPPGQDILSNAASTSEPEGSETEPGEPGTPEGTETEPGEPGTPEDTETESGEPGTSEDTETEPGELGTSEGSEVEPGTPGGTETEPGEPEGSGDGTASPGLPEGGGAPKVRQVVMCGKKLKFPFSLEKLTGQGFTYAVQPGEEGAEGKRLDIYYKGKKVSVMTRDAAGRVTGLGFYEFLDGFGDFSIAGVNGSTTRAAVEKRWGEGEKTAQGVQYGNELEYMLFGYNGKDRLKYVCFYSASNADSAEGGDAAENAPSAGNGEESPEDAQSETGQDETAEGGGVDYAAITGGDAAANLNEVLNHVTLGGRELSFPMTVQDLLNQGFSCEASSPLSNKKKDWSFFLINQGERLGTVRAHSRKRGTGAKKHKIAYLRLDGLQSRVDDFALCGVDRQSTREDVEKIWGEGRKTPWGLKYQNKEDGLKSVELYFSRSGKLSSVYITVEIGQ